MSEFDAGHTLGVDVGSATAVVAARTPDGRVRIVPVRRSADPGETLKNVRTAVRRTRPEAILLQPEHAAAASAAGFGAVRVIEAPLAATAYFTRVLGRSIALGGSLVVHDLGATTFEVAVVARRALGMEVVAADRRDLGGVDIDRRIVERIVERIGLPEELVLDRVSAARERLAARPTARVDFPGRRGEAVLSRDLVDDVALRVFRDSLRITSDLLRTMTLTDGTALFFIGGLMRMPALAAEARRVTTAAVTVDRPDTVLAHGAAVAAAPPPVDPPVAPARRWWRAGR